MKCYCSPVAVFNGWGENLFAAVGIVQNKISSGGKIRQEKEKKSKENKTPNNHQDTSQT